MEGSFLAPGKRGIRRSLLNPEDPMAHQLSAEMQDCIDRCQSCQEACLETMSYCLDMGGRHAETELIRMLIACAEICDTSARFMLMGSSLHTSTCAVCAEVCEACGRECERLEDDPTMQRCAETCRRCAESCRRMAKAVV